MVFQNNVLAGAAGSGTTTYAIDQSIRFNDNDSAYMYRTFGTATDQKTTTLSLWVKRCTLGTDQRIMVGATSAYSDSLYFRFNSNDTLEVINGPAAIYLKTTQIFRDTSAWYHIVFVLDTSNTISSERFRFYVNGQRITDVSAVYPSLNQTFKWNGPTGEHTIGTSLPSLGNYLDSYLAEIVFIDGQALDPSSFGEYNSSGIWVPKDVSGLTFGNNGFYLKGEDSADLGNDSSGNGNDFTVVNLASDDQKSDSPTSNHTTWNPLTTSAQTYSNGNLNSASSSSSWKGGLTTAQVPLNSGTWYYEIYVDSAGASSGQFSIGWSESNRSVSDDNSSGDTEGWVTYAINGNYYANGGTGSYGATYTTGDVIGCKIDTDSSTNNVEFYKNGASQGTISQAFNTGGTGFISPYILLYATRNATARFAQAEWTQTPSGITTSNAINTTNLGS